MFPLVTGINESETLKQISCESICRFGRKVCYSDQCWSNDKCWCERKKHHGFEKDYVSNRSTCSCIMDDLSITCDEIVESYDEETPPIPTKPV